MLLRIWTVFVARTREFYRDGAGLAWSLLFPVLIIIGFAFAFSNDNQASQKIGVYPAEALTSGDSLFNTRYTSFVPQPDLPAAIAKVGRHQLDLLVAWGDTVRYWVNATSSKGYFAESVVRTNCARPMVRQEATGRQVRYVDWLVPGILAMNMMFSALFGVGWLIVHYRINGVLKRLKATPLHAYEFIVAQVASRMVVILGSTIIVFAGTNAFLHFTMHGSWILLGAVFALGSFCMVSLGLLFSARFKSEEIVSGLVNFVTWPMMFLSGVWFSLEGTNHWLRTVALAFPLTHLVNAMRAIMLDGAGPTAIALPVGVLAAMSVVFVAAGAMLFKWE